jgi:hypothetical protein
MSRTMVGMMMAMTNICVAFIAMPPITRAERSPSPLRKISLHEPLVTVESTVVARAPFMGGRYLKMPAARWRNLRHLPRPFRPPTRNIGRLKWQEGSTPL